MKKKVIAYLHTHWDREWYREFEIFRMRLLRVFDEVIAALENELIPSFYFDGQTAALLDYLEIRPENETRIRDLIKQKKLFIGPFYCLIDEFLTSAELFRKNLEYGTKIARSFGCDDFTGYLPDTFGHSSGVIDILKDFGINECIVWRGCGDLPAEFVWKSEFGTEINAINLIRGYFMDIFTTGISIEKKAEFLKKNLDLAGEKSSGILLLPIGADHLGIPADIKTQIASVNERLEDYQIELGTIFDYIDAVKGNHVITHIGELRDNSKTFTLEGAYSSRADLKRENILCTYELERAKKLVQYFKLEDKYSLLIEYAYKLLLQNQAHDSICGCSTDDAHLENICRYKKIHQIAQNIEAEIRFIKKLDGKILNLGNDKFEGVAEITTDKISEGDIVFKTYNAFSSDLLQDTKRIPITEDYKPIYKVLRYIEAAAGENLDKTPSKQILSSENSITGEVRIEINDTIKIKDACHNLEIFPRDFKDLGDSYNRGCIKGDNGTIIKIKSCKNIFQSPLRAVLEAVYENNIILEISLDINSKIPKLKFEIDNRGKTNHHLMLCLNLDKPVIQTISEDMNRLIQREFDPDYNIRDNLPQIRGVEAKTNTAPCQRAVWTQGVGCILKGITQYEVYKNELRLSLLRAAGIISNPENSTRKTPAGPPITVKELQLQKIITQELGVFFGNEGTVETSINQYYNFLY